MTARSKKVLRAERRGRFFTAGRENRGKVGCGKKARVLREVKAEEKWRVGRNLLTAEEKKAEGEIE